MIKEGEFLIYSPFQKHDYYYPLQETRVIIWLHFAGCEIENILNELNIKPQTIYKEGFVISAGIIL